MQQMFKKHTKRLFISVGSGKELPWWQPYTYAIVGSLLFSWFVVYNGWPVFYDDTADYLGRPGSILGELGVQSIWAADPISAAPALNQPPHPDVPPSEPLANKVTWPGGRSAYYGTVMVVVSSIATSYGIAVLQAYLCALAISLAWFRLGGTGAGYLLAILFLAACTGSAVIIAALIPDIFAPIAILAGATLLVLWRELLIVDRVVLCLLLCFAALSHNSILALLLGFSILSAAALAFRWTRSHYHRLVPIWIASLAGIAGLIVFSLVAQKVTGYPPLDLPHISARVTTSEIGRRALRENCPSVQLVVCRYQSQIQRADWVMFLFSRNRHDGVFGVADLDTKYALLDEQFAVLTLVASQRPLQFLGLQLADIGRQLGSFSLESYDVSSTGSLAARVSPEVLSKVQGTQIYRTEGDILEVLFALSRLSTGAAVLLTLIYVVKYRPWRSPSQVEFFCALLILGVLGNAVICATLAGAHDRFQARVVWLLPLAAILLILVNRPRTALSSVPSGSEKETL